MNKSVYSCFLTLVLSVSLLFISCRSSNKETKEEPVMQVQKSDTSQMVTTIDTVTKESQQPVNPSDMAKKEKVTPKVTDKMTPKAGNESQKPPAVLPQTGNWSVPTHYMKMKNPNTVDQAFLEAGKTVYSKYCKSCHGINGEGNGVKAASFKTPMRSFLSKEVRNQPPGALYYKSIIGRGDMPNYEKQLADEKKRWAVVYYILSLGD